MSWREQIRSLRIPYPAKRELENEIELHMAHAPSEREQAFHPEALEAFYETHNTRLFRALDGNSKKFWIETLIAGFPLLTFLVLLTKETIVFEFIREGGPAMILITAIAAALLLREFILGVRVFIVKDHSKLRLDSTATLISAVALVFTGLLGTCGGLYRSAGAGGDHLEILIQGLRESLTCLIVASAAAAFVLLIHFAIRKTLMAWKAPAPLFAE